MNNELDALDRRVAEAMNWQWEGHNVRDDEYGPYYYEGKGRNISAFSPTRIPAQAIALLEMMSNVCLAKTEPTAYDNWQWQCIAENRDGHGATIDEYGDTPYSAITRAFLRWKEMSK